MYLIAGPKSRVVTLQCAFKKRLNHEITLSLLFFYE